MGDFRKLLVWQKAKELALDVYQLDTPNLLDDYRFSNQLRAAVISISNNIAEGDELDSNKQSVRHFNIAKGSCAEVKSMLILAQELNYLENTQFDLLFDKAEIISKMLYRLIQARKE